MKSLIIVLLCALLATTVLCHGKHSHGHSHDHGHEEETNNGGETNSVEDFVNRRITANNVYVFSKSYCPYCRRAKETLRNAGIEFGVVELDQIKNGADIQRHLQALTGVRTVPSVWIKGKYFGGSDATVAAQSSGKLAELVA
eukprot:TRINITY_DN15009_c0_g1_i1.p1 TRINITY_DN15009_c0_g1~~TRINITY_DN15009_c0_g1_i1.p1  ORF type:complete len:153 (+),score=25.61 TRINITY_DN15009_c0_g1_i1:35-460(+)